METFAERTLKYIRENRERLNTYTSAALVANVIEYFNESDSTPGVRGDFKGAQACIDELKMLIRSE